MTDWTCPLSLMARSLAAVALAIAVLHAGAATEETELVPAMLDLSDRELGLTEVPLHAVTPEMAANIGPGSHLFIHIPGAGTFGCSANFIWAGSGKHYLGAAGHCFLPPGKKATHGKGRDYDASGVVVEVCVEECTNGGFSGFVIKGKTVKLGQVAYARQTGEGGGLGNDFGIVEIPKELAERIRHSMPVFGGPTTAGAVQPGDIVCHYGNGIAVGEVFPTMGRMGIAVGEHSGGYWMANTAAAPGDSGSGVEVCQTDDGGVHGTSAVGVLTHLALRAGLVVGTTTARAIQMTRDDRGLSLDLVLGQ